MYSLPPPPSSISFSAFFIHTFITTLFFPSPPLWQEPLSSAKHKLKELLHSIPPSFSSVSIPPSSLSVLPVVCRSRPCYWSVVMSSSSSGACQYPIRSQCFYSQLGSKEAHHTHTNAHTHKHTNTHTHTHTCTLTHWCTMSVAWKHKSFWLQSVSVRLMEVFVDEWFFASEPPLFSSQQPSNLFFCVVAFCPFRSVSYIVKIALSQRHLSFFSWR